MTPWCHSHLVKKSKSSLFLGFDFFNVEKRKGKFFTWLSAYTGAIESNFYVAMELLIMIQLRLCETIRE
jgi:hypothetical protein